MPSFTHSFIVFFTYWIINADDLPGIEVYAERDARAFKTFKEFYSVGKKPEAEWEEDKAKHSKSF